jgi:hypothetical protein
VNPDDPLPPPPGRRPLAGRRPSGRPAAGHASGGPPDGEVFRRPALRVAADAEDLGRGLGRLVVVLLDVVRQLLERQAVRRMAAGEVTDPEIERLGRALLALQDQFTELRELLGVAPDDARLPVDLEALLPDEGSDRR